jgi:hypothetical protein
LISSFKNKVVRAAEGVKIFLAPVEDIIKMKKASGRDQDLSDIEMLRKVKRLKNAKNE